MPHDKNGTLVEKGDRVLVEFVVEDVQQSEDYCNLTVKTVLPMSGENAYNGQTSINSRQCFVVSKALKD